MILSALSIFSLSFVIPGDRFLYYLLAAMAVLALTLNLAARWRRMQHYREQAKEQAEAIRLAQSLPVVGIRPEDGPELVNWSKRTTSPPRRPTNYRPGVRVDNGRVGPMVISAFSDPQIREAWPSRAQQENPDCE